MDIQYSYETTGVDWEALEGLYRSNQMGGRSRDKLRRAFENSYAACFATRQGQLIGAARAISDGEYHAGIYDVAVLPEFQGQGIGREMMQRLLGRLSAWRVTLVCDGDNKDFYRKLGFDDFDNVMARFYPEYLYND